MVLGPWAWYHGGASPSQEHCLGQSLHCSVVLHLRHVMLLDKATIAVTHAAHICCTSSRQPCPALYYLFFVGVNSQERETRQPKRLEETDRSSLTKGTVDRFRTQHSSRHIPTRPTTRINLSISLLYNLLCMNSCHSAGTRVQSTCTRVTRRVTSPL